MSEKLYKTELHCHTSLISACAHVTPEDTAEEFIKAGYTTLVITDHLSPTFFNKIVPEGMTDPRQLADLYMSGYRTAKAQAGDRLNVLLGMELRVRENMNDYLIYGIDEQFVYDMFETDIMGMRVKEISAFVHEHGALIFQAHPFRDTMTVTNPKLLDGIEVINYTASHNSRNEIALIWSKTHNLKRVVGTDYHNLNYIRGAGILTDTPITDSANLKEVLDAQNFKFTDGFMVRDINLGI